MANFIQRILRVPVISLANKISSKPDKTRVHNALTALYENIIQQNQKKGITISFNANTDKFILFSDQHKGAKNKADDFAYAEQNYLTALDYYFNNGFTFINMGDSEELWENMLISVKKHNQPSFEKEKKFLDTGRGIKLFGNHDLYWANDPFAPMQLQNIFQRKIPIYEGCVLKTSVNNKELNIFITHGHQGDAQSDGNAFSKWFVANIWAPLQSWLQINSNTPAASDELKTLHNQFMYEWSCTKQNVILITGHTHQPVFESLTHLERLYRQLSFAKTKNDPALVDKVEAEIRNRRKEYSSIHDDFISLKPTYFNTGCCCFSDGDITGIEISDGVIRLIKWKYDKNNNSEREILEEMKLQDLL